jgi:hypothetical protein
MTDLSPQAQAVLDALYLEELNGPQQLMARAHAAAALRAAAEILSQDQMDHYAPDIINDIAAELEGGND